MVCLFVTGSHSTECPGTWETEIEGPSEIYQTVKAHLHQVVQIDMLQGLDRFVLKKAHSQGYMLPI